MPGWKLHGIPDLDGCTAVVTGGNAGLGFRSVLALARRGARVMIACRSIDTGDGAAQRVLSELPAARLDTTPSTSPTRRASSGSAGASDRARIDRTLC